MASVIAQSLSDIHHQVDTGTQGDDSIVQDFNTQKFGTLTFPADIESTEYFAMFSPFEYSRENRSSGPAKSDLRGSIVLPLPSDLSTGYGANYSQEELGITGLATSYAAGLAKEVMSSFNNDRSRGASSMTESFMKAKNALQDNAAGATAAGGLMVDDFFTSAISIQTGYQRNPHLAVLFEGVGFRQHRFSYKFTPKNEFESLSLYNIIRVFKAAMHPSYEQPFKNHLFKYPDEWDIDFSAPQFKIGPSVLLDFSINYHGEGIPSYFRDHQPVTTVINLTFQETSIVTREDVLDRGR